MEICSHKQILNSSLKHILDIKMNCRDDADENVNPELEGWLACFF